MTDTTQSDREAAKDKRSQRRNAMRIIRGLIGLPFYLVARALAAVAFLLFDVALFVCGEDEPFLDYPVEWE